MLGRVTEKHELTYIHDIYEYIFKHQMQKCGVDLYENYL